MTTTPDRSARPIGIGIVLGIGLLVLLLDQVTKALVVAHIPFGTSIPVVGDLLILWHVRNSGAAFSLFQGGTVLFMVVTVVALGMIVYFHRAFAGRSLWLQALLGLILGGTLGNLVDRVRQGYVTDFVSFGFGSTRFPTFNVADSSIVVGIGTLVIVLMLLDRQQETVTA
jgi:signal peptidase II